MAVQPSLITLCILRREDRFLWPVPAGPCDRIADQTGWQSPPSLQPVVACERFSPPSLGSMIGECRECLCDSRSHNLPACTLELGFAES